MQDLRNQSAVRVRGDAPCGRGPLPSGTSNVLLFRTLSQQFSSCVLLKCMAVQPCPLVHWSEQSRPCGLVLIRIRGSSTPGRFSQARFSILGCPLAESTVRQSISVCHLICPARLTSQFHDLHNTALSLENYLNFIHH